MARFEEFIKEKQNLVRNLSRLHYSGWLRVSKKDRAAFLFSEVIKGSDLFHHLALPAGGACGQHTGALRAPLSDQQSLLAFE